MRRIIHCVNEIIVRKYRKSPAMEKLRLLYQATRVVFGNTTQLQGYVGKHSALLYPRNMLTNRSGSTNNNVEST